MYSLNEFAVCQVFDSSWSTHLCYAVFLSRTTVVIQEAYYAEAGLYDESEETISCRT